MGRTIPSFQIATKREKRKWMSFRQELDKSERKIFDSCKCIVGLGNKKPQNRYQKERRRC